MLKPVVITLFLVALTGYNSSNGLSFKSCDTVSDSFKSTYPNWEGCNQSVEYLMEFIKSEGVSYDQKQYRSSVVSSEALEYLPKNPKPIATLIIYGPLLDKKKRKENYVVFIGEGKMTTAILPRYSYY